MATIEIQDTKRYGRTYKFRTLIGAGENGVRQHALRQASGIFAQAGMRKFELTSR